MRLRPDAPGYRNDPVEQYLNDIGRYPRLSREQEVDLGRRAAAGDVDAQDALVRSNLRLVVAIAKHYTRRGRFDLLELVSPGNEGLIVASRRYDVEADVPFGNFASIWIRQRIMRYVAGHGFDVHVPAYRSAVVNKVVRTASRLEQTLERPAQVDEVAQVTGCTESEVAEVLSLMQPSIELDAPIEGASGAVVGAYLSPTSSDSSALDKGDAARLLNRVTMLLPEREAQVVRWSFGLGGIQELDLGAIAARLGVSRERVRQMRAAALRRLAEDPELRGLFGSFP
jgi:RNA polymerase primary sigma factor